MTERRTPQRHSRCVATGNFLRMPHWRDPAVGNGPIMDTFETATTWDR